MMRRTSNSVDRDVKGREQKNAKDISRSSAKISSSNTNRSRERDRRRRGSVSSSSDSSDRYLVFGVHLIWILKILVEFHALVPLTAAAHTAAQIPTRDHPLRATAHRRPTQVHHLSVEIQDLAHAVAHRRRGSAAIANWWRGVMECVLQRWSRESECNRCLVVLLRWRCAKDHGREVNLQDAAIAQGATTKSLTTRADPAPKVRLLKPRSILCPQSHPGCMWAI